MNTRQLGFIGLGHMGGRIARRLVDAGIEVLGLDTAPERAAAAGARTAAGVRDVVAFADVVLLSLPDSHVVEAVVEGAEGVLATSRAGQTTKLLNNFLNAAALAATAEVMVAGKKAGLDLHVLPDVLNSSSGVNFVTLNRFPKIVDGDYLEGGLTSKRMTKDRVLYIDLVRELGVASLNASGPLASSRRRCHRRHVGWHPIGGCKRPQNRSDAMKVFQGRAGTVSERRSATFSGVVWADPMMPTIDKVTVNSVCFTPGARTFWHTHEQGQILQVTSGSGFVCLDGEAPQTIRTGDVVWIGANERHWHGAGSDTLMVHTATSLGTTHWAEEVLEEVYRKAAGTGSPRLL